MYRYIGIEKYNIENNKIAFVFSLEHCNIKSCQVIRLVTYRWHAHQKALHTVHVNIIRYIYKPLQQVIVVY